MDNITQTWEYSPIIPNSGQYMGEVGDDELMANLAVDHGMTVEEIASLQVTWLQVNS